MPRFTFHLDAVLRQRQNAERQRQQEVAQALLKSMALQRQMRELDAQVSRAMDEMRGRTQGGVVDVKFALAQSEFVAGLRRRSTELGGELALAEIRTQEARALLARDAQRRRIIEKLREKQFDRWRRETSRRQFIEDDDIGARWAAAQT